MAGITLLFLMKEKKLSSIYSVNLKLIRNNTDIFNLSQSHLFILLS